MVLITKSQGSIPLIVNNMLWAMNNSQEMKKLMPYIHIISVATVENCLITNKNYSILMDIDTATCTCRAIYAMAAYSPQSKVVTVNLYHTFSRPLKGRGLPTLSTKGDCFEHCSSRRNWTPPCEEGDTASESCDYLMEDPYAIHYYGDNKNFVIASHSVFIPCKAFVYSLDEDFYNMHMTDSIEKAWTPLIQKMGFTGNSAPSIWDFSNYF